MNNNEEWVKQFEALTGRKPTANEFVKGKEDNFDINKLAEMVGANQANSVPQVNPAKPVNPAPQANQGQPEVNQVAGQEGNQPKAQAGVAGPAQGASVGGQGQMPLPEQASQQGQASQQPNPNMQSAFNQPFQQSGFPGVPTQKSNTSELILGLVLPIISLVLSVLFAGLSFTPAAVVFLILAVLGLIFAGVLLLLNLKGKKLLSIIASGVALLAVIVSVGGLLVNNSRQSSGKSDNSSTVSSSKKKDNGTKVKDNSTDVSDYTDKNYKFEWKQSDLSDMKIDSDKVSDVIKEHGKASEAEISGDNLTLTYKDSSKSDDDGTQQQVRVAFKKQYDGTWVLSYVSGDFKADDITTDSSYKADWSKSDFDALKVGDDETGSGGTSWSDVKSKHSKPSEAYYSVSMFTKGEVEKSLNIVYSDYDADDSHARSVRLEFKSSDDGKTYNLSSKYGYGAGIKNDDK
ncbi:hypothetical protein [Streptococcus sobrinus]|uniref:hypothetical protein n=1 Tax=Streptococcus sobrinus TaxID=1310 RepID=UPI0002F32189|nr:hypothetical protein [Streptococcus sobrinus]OZV23725.1 hypothetical protein RO09_04490 [Streptococcus sobrinus]